MRNNSSLTDNQRIIFELTNCQGKLTWSDNFLEINFKLSCRRDGSLLVSCDPIPRSLQSNKFEMDRDSTQSRTVQQYTLTGLGPDGVQIATKYASVSVEKLISQSNFIDLELSIQYLELDWQSTKTDVSREIIALEYQIPGLECLGSIEVEAPFGKVGVAGATKVEDYRELTGIITITARPNPNLPEATQLKEIDSAVRRLLDVLSLAEGRFMEWSIRNRFSDDQIRSGVFRGPKHSSESRYPLFSFLNLQPVVKLAVEQYTEEQREKTGLDVAIKWFLIRSQYTEIQCLTMMTALEHLIHIFRKRHP